MQILLIEDEPGIADFIQRGLAAEGFDVAWSADGAEGLERALDPAVGLVVLDRMLPSLDGLELLGRLRGVRPALPVIMLTARGEVADRVEGLDHGANDYVVKPFALAELIARVRAHLRAPTAADTTLRAAGIELDLVRRTATRGDLSVALSPRETDLLALLMRQPGQALSRERILAAVWRYDHDPRTNVVDVYISYLRRKLELPSSPAPIATVRSVGYRLVP